MYLFHKLNFTGSIIHKYESVGVKKEPNLSWERATCRVGGGGGGH